MPNVTFSKASAVVVGVFNVHIVQPSWLAKAGIIAAEDGDETSVQMDLEQPGFRFHRKESPEITWVVRPDRLAIEATTIDADPAVLAAKVLDLLSHTPLRAVGVNFHYRGGTGLINSIKSLGFPKSFKAKGYTVKQRSWHVALQAASDSLVRNIQLGATDDFTDIIINFHADAQAGGVATAIAALKGFRAKAKESEELIREIFQVNVECQ